MGPGSRSARAGTLAVAAALVVFGLAPAASASPPDHAQARDVPSPASSSGSANTTGPQNAPVAPTLPDKAAREKPGKPTTPDSDDEVELPETADVDYYASTPPGLLDNGSDEDDSDDQGDSEDEDSTEGAEDPDVVEDDEEDSDDEDDERRAMDDDDETASDDIAVGGASTSPPAPTTTVPGIEMPAEPVGAGGRVLDSTPDPIPASDEPAVSSLAPSTAAQNPASTPSTLSTPSTGPLGLEDAPSVDPDASVSASIADWTMFFEAQPELAAQPINEPQRGTTARVLSWLVEREAVGSTMAAMTPIVALTTIWDAVSSAGSGLAAPASGLLTFTALVLLDRRRLRGVGDRPKLRPSALRAS